MTLSYDSILTIVPSLLRDALLGEVYTTPKPGLVDLHDTGSHRDMDVRSFERSTEAILPFLTEMFRLGYRGTESELSSYTEEEQIFLTSRRIGLEAEQAMLEATQGVNTHKGMIFSMGIVCAALGIALRKGSENPDANSSKPSSLASDARALPLTIPGTEDILDIAKAMTHRILQEDFVRIAARPPKTHGERLYHAYGERGIRGQAMDGYPILRATAIPALGKHEAALPMGKTLTPERNAAQLYTLLRIMAVLDDTNVLTRSDYATMHTLKEEASQILRLGGPYTKEGWQAIEALNDRCIERNISPGGAADILAVAILLHQLQHLSELLP